MTQAQLDAHDRDGSGLPRRELLTSQRGADGHWHAFYPTATMLLCGKPVGAFKPGRKWPPDCPACKTVAEAWHRIDKAMPDHWLTYTVAPVEKDAA